MKQLVVFPKGQLTQKDKERLTKNGFVWVECDEPENVKCIIPTSGSTIDDLFAAAVHGLSDEIYDRPAKRFVNELNRKLNKNS